MTSPSALWTMRLLLLLLPTIANSQSWRRERRQNTIYSELQNLKATCRGLDTCQGSTGLRNLQATNCHCDSVCNMLDTCCLDSPYRSRSKQQNLGRFWCDQPYGATSESVFLVFGCSPGWRGDKSVERLCDADARELRDPFLMVPVTDRRTGITYKNLYCYVCNGLDERRNPYFFWQLKLFSDPTMNNNSGPGLFRRMQSGRIPYQDYIFNDFYFYPSLEAPERYQYRLRLCRDTVTETCDSDWTDAETRKKCGSYTAIVKAMRPRYQRFKNPHCAICNGVKVSDLSCSEKEEDVKMARGPPYGYLFVGLLSMEDKVQRCPRNQVFDAFSNKCRAVRCGARRTMVEGECVPDARNPNRPRRAENNPGSRQSWLVMG